MQLRARGQRGADIEHARQPAPVAHRQRAGIQADLSNRGANERAEDAAKMKRAVDRIAVEEDERLIRLASVHVETGGPVAARLDTRQELNRAQDIRLDERRDGAERLGRDPERAGTERLLKLDPLCACALNAYCGHVREAERAAVTHCGLCRLAYDEPRCGIDHQIAAARHAHPEATRVPDLGERHRDGALVRTNRDDGAKRGERRIVGDVEVRVGGEGLNGRLRGHAHETGVRGGTERRHAVPIGAQLDEGRRVGDLLRAHRTGEREHQHGQVETARTGIHRAPRRSVMVRPLRA